MNIDKFVAVNNVQEVSNAMLMDKSYNPTPDGLLSTEIFGHSAAERRITFGYINLNCHVFQPLAYKNVKALDRRIVDVIAGSKKVIIVKDGTLEENEDKGETGIDFLYDNWDKIKFKKNESKIRNQRIEFLECHSKDEIFQSKEIVLPAFYRDINLQSSSKSKPAVHVINNLYTKLIRYASTLNQGEFTFTLNYTKYQIQQTLEEIYSELKAKIEKKRGLIKQSVLGKNVDYGLRVVISAGDMRYNSPSDMLMDFRHCGIPLHFCISLFQPFFVGWVQNFFQREFELMGNKIAAKTKSGEITYVKIVDPLIQFNDDKIHEMMKTFIYSRGERFSPIEIELEDGTKKPFAFRGTLESRGENILDKDYPEQLKEVENEDNIISRPMTLTDLFYIAAEEIVKDKHVYITRYPMADYSGIFPIGISVLSTIDTVKMKIGDKIYPYYPKVDLKASDKEVSRLFIEVLNLMNTYLKAIGGDYDGDQITVKSVYSQEANLEASKKMFQLSNLLTVNGSNIRLTTIEALQCLYMTTRWGNPKEEKVSAY